MPASPNYRAPLYYRLLVTLLRPVVVLVSLRQSLKTRDWRYFRQRLGHGFPRLTAGTAQKPLWIHCASVGEVRAATALIRQLRQQYPQQPITLSSGTCSSGALVASSLADAVTHVYLPFDTPGAVQRFFRALQPRAGIILETEIWPVLFAACRQQSIPLIIANGRLSTKTLRAPRWLQRLYAQTLQHVSRILARSQRDADGFEQLGMPATRIEVIGNIKLAAQPQAEGATLPRLIEGEYWLAASTHKNEEHIVAQIQRQLGTAAPLLVIAPRHPDRRSSILSTLDSVGLSYAVRSRGDAITPQTRIYLADTLGELETLMRHARLVFMGGSLVPVGGHNLLEPAALGKALLTGPHLHNFRDEATLLQQHQGMRVVEDAAALQSTLQQLLADPAQCTRMGAAAAAALAGKHDVMQDYLRALALLIPLQQG